MKKLVRKGSVIKLYKYIEDSRSFPATYWKLIWRFNLYLFLYIPLMLTIAAFLVFLYEKRYEACMRIFNDFWFCALR